MRIRRSTRIESSPDAVYGLVMDPARLDEWVSIHDSLPQAPNGELRTGSTLTQRLKLAGQRFTVRWKVTEADRPRRVVWEGQGPVRSRARVVYELAERNGATRFSYLNEYELPGGAVGRLAGQSVARTAEREMERSLDRLKALLES